ncbi:MAG: zinc-ribbon domain-containing protein [Candidatus Bathyarchaeota archaeon]
MSKCPQCEDEVREDAAFCPNCGYNLKQGEVSDAEAPGERKRSYTEHLTIAYNVANQNPTVFVPALLAGIISSGLNWLGQGSLGVMAILVSIAASIIAFMLSFASLDMSRDAYNRQPLDLGESMRYVSGRFLEFLVAAIVGGIMSITIILIPVVVLMFSIMVIDETGLTNSLSRAFSVLGADLSDILLILLVNILGSFIISYVPLVSGLLNSALNVIIGLAFIDLYYNYKRPAQG